MRDEDRESRSKQYVPRQREIGMPQQTLSSPFSSNLFFLKDIVAVVTPVTKGTPSEETRYRVCFVSRPDVAPFDPPLPYPSIFAKTEIRAILIAKRM